jgi:hypothetical protein
VDYCFFGPLFSLYPDGDHSLDPSHLVEDCFMDNNPDAAGPNDYGACYSVVDTFSLPKTEPACHFCMSSSISNLRAMHPLV